MGLSRLRVVNFEYKDNYTIRRSVHEIKYTQQLYNFTTDLSKILTFIQYLLNATVSFKTRQVGKHQSTGY